ncbi:pilus assembly FimT family protein [Massilia sp. TWR1-2-2]|uniref:pilus assembly FimT family protein n=1 Tax=Massilia sp. TWR1-2-2 TaxID=2804584 RepID=UPI003CE8BF2D
MINQWAGMPRTDAPRAGLRRQRGVTLFEFAVVAAIFALLVGVGLNRLHIYQHHAEKLAAEQVVAAMRLALQMRVVQLYAQQRLGEPGAIADENPIGWLQRPPRNYLGELRSPDPRTLAPGNWYYDPGERKLIYLLLSIPDSFAPGPLILLIFKVESTRLPLDPALQAPSGRVANVALIQISDQ